MPTVVKVNWNIYKSMPNIANLNFTWRLPYLPTSQSHSKIWYQTNKYAEKLNFFDALNSRENIHRLRLPCCVWCKLFRISSYNNDVFNVIPVNTCMYLKNGTINIPIQLNF